MKTNVQKRVSLTPRDLLLLEELYKNVVLSFPQVCRKVFRGKAKSTVLNRLGRLEGYGVIQRWKVPRFKAGLHRNEILVVFQITRQGIRELAKRRTGTGYREEPLRLHGFSIEHDVLLVDVLEALGARFPGVCAVNGRLLEREEETSGTNPDAILEFPQAHERWAVELELTAKSERRYREIVLRYRLDRNISRVLYVLPGERVTHKLARVLEQKPERLSSLPPKEKFLFTTLEELFQSKTNTNLNEKGKIIA